MSGATTTAAAGETAEESPETYAALVAAEKNVIARAEQVREVAESGSRLRDRWEALDDALRDYRRALVRHYIALGEPTSEMSSGDTPDNREYHEFGHYFHASLFSQELPLHPENQPHGGYYRNPSSSDS